MSAYMYLGSLGPSPADLPFVVRSMIDTHGLVHPFNEGTENKN